MKFPVFAPKEYKNDIFSISELYHENSKWRLGITESIPKMVNEKTQQKMAEAFKTYPEVDSIPLPRKFQTENESLENAIYRRRSIRDFSSQQIEQETLARLLFFANGVTTVTRFGSIYQPFRAAPSAGALYPIEIYPIIFRVENVTAGLYHYNVRTHVIELLKSGDYSHECYSMLLDQEFVKHCSVLFALTAIFPRTRIKYGERGYRFVLLDAGHICQNIYLLATNLGLGAVSVGGFLDDELNEFLQIDGVNEAAVYLVAVGNID